MLILEQEPLTRFPLILFYLHVGSFLCLLVLIPVAYYNIWIGSYRWCPSSKTLFENPRQTIFHPK